MWDETRRAAETRRRKAFWDSPAMAELGDRHRREEEAIAAWLAGQQGVEATRTTSAATAQQQGCS
jgi:hypothetical protein